MPDHKLRPSGEGLGAGAGRYRELIAGRQKTFEREVVEGGLDNKLIGDSEEIGGKRIVSGRVGIIEAEGEPAAQVVTALNVESVLGEVEIGCGEICETCVG